MHEYIDRAASAKHEKVSKRVEFQRMIRESKRGAFDVLLVHKYNRFARSRYDHAVYGQMLKDYGIQLIAVAENFGTGKESILMEGLLQSLSEYYLADLSEEVKKGHKENALQALHNGGYAPFGYDVINQQYVINELEAAYVRRMFDACLRGVKYNEILDDLKTAGITGKRGRALGRPSIYEILRNEKYTGVYVYCPTENGKRRDKSQAIRIENALPAIIDRGSWEGVQKIMDGRKNNGRKPKVEYLLSGRIFCECGAPMHGLTTHKKKNDIDYEYSYYVCSAKCENQNIKTKDIDKAIFDYLQALLSEENRTTLQTTLQNYTRAMKAIREADSTNIKKEIADREKQIDTLMQNMGAAILPPAVLENMGKKITELHEQIETLTTELERPLSFSKNEILKYFDAVADLEHQTEEMRRNTVKRFIEKVEIKKNAIDVTSTFMTFLKINGCGGRI